MQHCFLSKWSENKLEVRSSTSIKPYFTDHCRKTFSSSWNGLIHNFYNKKKLLSQKILSADIGGQVPQGESNLNQSAFSQQAKHPTNVQNIGLQ